MNTHYTAERNAQIVLFLLKKYGIKKVIASPGTTNITILASMQQDSFFEMYSAADERSAAYMACGLAAETGEPVVLSCTGATASRNYLPGLTEAFYRKLPILAITSHQGQANIGNHIAQVLDRSVVPNDVAIYSTYIRSIRGKDDEWEAETKANKALIALTTRGNGPVHINLETLFGKDFTSIILPEAHFVRYVNYKSEFPPLPNGKIIIFIGSHLPFSEKTEKVIEKFCEENNAVVFCDHTSNYKGNHRFLHALLGHQKDIKESVVDDVELVIHLGEVSGDTYTTKLLKRAHQTWRISEDGVYRDTFRNLSYVFELDECYFFEKYIKNTGVIVNSFQKNCQQKYIDLFNSIPDSIPFSNIWMASVLASKLPEFSEIHFGIFNSLRSWNLFEIPNSVQGFCNVGGFGIDGGVSSLVGASLANNNKLYFGVFGDLAFFYDINSIANRHRGNNIRILLINNGKGTEFRNYHHLGAQFGEDADEYIAAAGHYGNKSKVLIKHYSEDLGFKYLSASNKTEFLEKCNEFTNPNFSQAILFEVFTESTDESNALYIIDHLIEDNSKKEELTTKIKRIAKSVLGENAISMVKTIIKK